MSDDRHVTVNFPAQMQVHSPKTDETIDAMRLAFQSFSKMLEASVQQIQDSLRNLSQLPAMMTGLQQTVTLQFSGLFQHLSEMAAAGHVAVMHACMKKKEAAAEVLESRRGRLGDERARLSERYGKLLEQVSQDCERRVQQTDSHAFEIVEEVYPRQVQARFEFESMPAVKLLADQADEWAMARSLCLDEKLDALLRAIESVACERRALEAALGGLPATDRPPGWYRLPFFVAETRHEVTGERRLHVLGRGSLDPAASERLGRMVRDRAARGGRSPLAPADAEAIAQWWADEVDPLGRQRFLESAGAGSLSWLEGGAA